MELKPPPFTRHGTEEQRIEVSADEILNAIAEGRDVDVKYATINGDMEEVLERDENGFRIIKSALGIQSCMIEGASFNSVQFNEAAFFSYTKFSGDTWFLGAQFNSDVFFHTAQFSGTVDFTATRFGGNTVFAGAHFGGRCCFSLVGHSRTCCQLV
jgi:hypothetical protein